jgi:hypothetical protein
MTVDPRVPGGGALIEALVRDGFRCAVSGRYDMEGLF